MYSGSRQVTRDLLALSVVVAQLRWLNTDAMYQAAVDFRPSGHNECWYIQDESTDSEMVHFPGAPVV